MASSRKQPRLRPTAEQAKRLLFEIKSSASSVKKQELRARFFDKQLRLADDPDRLKAALCSRRAGKTFCAAAMLLDAALSIPNCIVLYVRETLRDAKRGVWLNPDSGLLALNERFGLGGVPHNTEITMTMPNGSRIWVWGVEDVATAQKLRGDAYHLVIIDEAQNQKEHVLEVLLDDVLPACCRDTFGTVVLMGTPGVVCSGKFHDVTEGIEHGWSVHKWTQHDNVHFPAALELIKKKAAKTVREAVDRILDDELIKKKRVRLDPVSGKLVPNREHPKFLREDMGIWVTDVSNLLYRYQRARDAYHDLPEAPMGSAPHRWRHVMGVDWGVRDAFAIVVWAFSKTHDHVFEVFSDSMTDLGANQQMDAVMKVHELFGTEIIVADPGSGTDKIVELRRKHGLPIVVADKVKKKEFIDLLNGDLIDGKIKVRPEGKLVEEWEELVCGKDGKEALGSVDHCSDAGLYAWRHVLKLRGYVTDALSHAETKREPNEWIKQRQSKIKRRQEAERDAGYID